VSWGLVRYGWLIQRSARRCAASGKGMVGMSYGHTPGEEQPGQQASFGYGEPGSGMLGYAPSGSPPPTYRVWGIIAIICGVFCSLILGFPAALIGRSYGGKVTDLWAGGDVQAAVRASRTARAWLIASTVLDVIGLILLSVSLFGAY
jgi:hypothetical protein